MKNLLIIAVIAMLAWSLAGCAPRSDETSPEMAQSMLKLRGFSFTVDDFFKAVRLNDAAAVRLFLQAGIDPNAKSASGESVLNFAIQNSSLPTVKVLLEKADVSMHDDFGNSPLFWSIKKDKPEIFELLMEKNANVNSVGTVKSTKNQSALYAAVLWEKTDMVKRLLEKGADPNLADSDGAIPLHDVAIRQRPNMEIFKLLLDAGSNVNKQESNGSTPLLYAAAQNQMPSETRVEIVKTLLARGADKKLKDKNGMTALDWARKNKNSDVVELLK